MEKDIATLRQVVDQAIDEHPRINRMEADITVLKSEQHRQGLLMEDMDRKMDRLIDALLPANTRAPSLIETVILRSPSFPFSVVKRQSLLSKPDIPFPVETPPTLPI